MQPLSAAAYFKLSSRLSAQVCNISEPWKQEKKPRKKEDQRHRKPHRNVKFLAAPLLSAILTLSDPLLPPPDSLVQSVPQNGTALFQKSCIGCHDMGGNILQPGATLFMKDLERNGIFTEEDIYKITYYGKGRMPGFGEKCAPRGQCTFAARLQDEEIKLLAEFVRSQAQRGWPNVEIYGD
ncbi:Cytochrome c6, chloroplastic [Apostasia shenzhenica]|uniref:Cytochrome c-553 n=1 Tax=Apostasia shenzhenica TaxID=1088818 RepID=A0A2I0AAI7_9ASPA|nr:Cytochrome c6, chloroplastic [Apostasia shenzhenica]